MSTYIGILPGIYPERQGLGGSSLGYVGTGTVCVVGKGSYALPAPTLRFVSSRLVAGAVGIGTYDYVVSTLNANGESLKSADVAVVLAGASEVLLSWTSTPGATGYKLYRKVHTDSWVDAVPHLIATDITVTSYRDTVVTPAAGKPVTTATDLGIAVNIPTMFFSTTALRIAVGAETDLGLASFVADRVGLTRFMVVSVTDTGTASDFEAALNTIRNKDVNHVVCLANTTAIGAKLLAHVTSMSTTDERKWRVGYYPSAIVDTVGDPQTADTAIYNARSYNNKSMLVTFPNTAVFSTSDNDGVQVTATVAGQYLACACAMLKSIVGNAGEQITYKTMSVFDSFAYDLLDSEESYLIEYGVTPVISAAGVQKVIRGVTTSLASLEEAELSIVLEDYDLMYAFKTDLASFIGKRITGQLVSAIDGRTGQILTGKVRDGIITTFANISVYQDTTTPDTIYITFTYTPMYSVNTIRVQWSYDLRTGSLT